MIQLTQQEKDAIKADAKTFADDLSESLSPGNHSLRKGYIAGATSERIKAKELVKNIQEHIHQWEQEPARASRLVQKEIDSFNKNSKS